MIAVFYVLQNQIAATLPVVAQSVTLLTMVNETDNNNCNLVGVQVSPLVI